MTRTHSQTRQELQVSDTDWCLRMQKGIVCIHYVYELVYCNDVRDHMDFVYILCMLAIKTDFDIGNVLLFLL